MNIAEAIDREAAFDPLFAITDVCEFLNFKRSKVYELLANGELAAIKLSNSTRIKRSELQRYLNTARPAVIKKSVRRVA
ncbi:MAG: helix-turn-helix domain-containing protein [Roseiarcus sp.]|jgi:excisionase family DNA binding protein